MLGACISREAEVKSRRLGKPGSPGELRMLVGGAVCESVGDAVEVSGLQEALDEEGWGGPSSSEALAHRCCAWTSPDQQHQHHLGPCQRHKFLDSAPDLACQRF